uniref:Uncharacterized protein n=1 Tax=Glossina pallidipes TaxID=7398 RepID=A0A1A9ZNP8_GLOPL
MHNPAFNKSENRKLRKTRNWKKASKTQVSSKRNCGIFNALLSYPGPFEKMQNTSIRMPIKQKPIQWHRNAVDESIKHFTSPIYLNHSILTAYITMGKFDTGLARHQAMTVSHYEYFRPTGHAFRWGFGLVVFPIVLYGWASTS